MQRLDLTVAIQLVYSTYLDAEEEIMNLEIQGGEASDHLLPFGPCPPQTI